MSIEFSTDALLGFVTGLVVGIIVGARLTLWLFGRKVQREPRKEP